MEFPQARQRLHQLIQSSTFDLAEAALCIAQEEYPDLEIETYLTTLDSMAAEIRTRLPDVAYPLRVIQAINSYLFDELGYVGNQKNYYDPRNSFLNDVINRRMGIPLTLSLVYLEIARRIDFPMVGVNFPGHFLIRPERDDIDFHVDPFNRGDVLFAQDCENRLMQLYGQPLELEARFIQTVTPQQFLTRMLMNLKQIYLHLKQLEKSLAVSERIILINPQSEELRDRGLLYYQLGHWAAARQDFTDYLDLYPLSKDKSLINQLLDQMDKGV
ncbi:hypothetical protein C1752_10197 [Acaryochloris thomasi RCC1774]|uniref:Protein SirB1 N-terminal domain-containing protein n=1 Tax=Acaryochloris thomasi RCC1774 TaxID=1764569 RepID=A0A2W1JHT6_9CYAN|nr:transglutaminase-like domain-containing protein [Acaryochloris thomasi]PZD70682.1 hypothetical protein C1752_10197 [Acaryochloris thomasi RCC1774]